MNEETFRRLAFGAEKPKPSGKDSRRIRRMLREGIPPASMPFDPKEVDKIYAKLPMPERQKIVKKVVSAEVEVEVTDEQADKMIHKMVRGPFIPPQSQIPARIPANQGPRHILLPSSQMP